MPPQQAWVQKEPIVVKKKVLLDLISIFIHENGAIQCPCYFPHAIPRSGFGQPGNVFPPVISRTLTRDFHRRTCLFPPGKITTMRRANNLGTVFLNSVIPRLIFPMVTKPGVVGGDLRSNTQCYSAVLPG